MISFKHFYVVLFVATLFVSACTPNREQSETIKCDGRCVVIFKPAEAEGKEALDGDDEKEFLEVLADHQRFADEFKKTAKDSSIKVFETTAHHIKIENGETEKEFAAREGEDLFGFILTKPNAEPEIHRGIFTDMEYRMHAQKYFK